LVDRLPICMNGVDGVHDWSLIAYECLRISLELPLYLFAWSIDKTLNKIVGTFAFYGMYLCCFLRLIVYLCMRFEILLVMYYETWDMVVEVLLYIAELFWCCFPLRVFMKINLCMLWENEDVTYKLFLLIDLFAWCIAF